MKPGERERVEVGIERFSAASRRGLIWTRDISKAHQMAAALKAGTVWINTHGMLDTNMPFGGYKQSGWGREYGKESIELYTQMKSVFAQL